MNNKLKSQRMIIRNCARALLQDEHLLSARVISHSFGKEFRSNLFGFYIEIVDRAECLGFHMIDKEHTL